MALNYLDDLVNQLLKGTFSVFCGAGASIDATKKEWCEILPKGAQEFYKINKDVYLLADLEKLYSGISEEEFLAQIIENLRVPEGTESQLINAVVDLNLNQVWTTNFDTVIEDTIKRKFKIVPTVIKESNDLLTSPLDSAYTIYKLNGSVDDPKTMVITKSDFFNYFKKQRLLFESLKRQLVLDTFLFIGYSFKDELVLSALREIHEVFPERGKQHYRFVLESADKKQESPEAIVSRRNYNDHENRYFEDKYNIKTITFRSSEEINNYLGEIYTRFCNHNVFICGSFRDITRDERIRIENIVKQLIKELFQEGFNIYSGNGRGLGEIVVAQVDKHNRDNNNKCNGKLVNRPLIFTGDNKEEKSKKNRYIMKDCNIMIIICGQDDEGTSKNVKRQFEQFLQDRGKEYHPAIIPIPITGYAAEEIFHSKEYRDCAFFKENKEQIEHLFNGINENITKDIVKLISCMK